MENESNSLQSRLILECQELCDQYDLCRARLHQLAKEVEALRQENSDLRSANRELVEHLNILSEARMRENFLCYDFRRLSVGEGHGVDEVCGISPTSVIQRKGFRRNVEHIPLPKSISVRSSCYLKMNHSGRSNKAASPQPLNNPLVHATCGREQQRSHVPRGRGAEEEEEEEEAVKVEVYNQGMFKTELCNKWQEKGTCPYGDLCQFAHGITELRPIIRHPRYKTEVCRMVLAGATCPYGHRCHFRHSLSPP